MREIFNLIFSRYQKKCPWCGAPINILKMLFLKQVVRQCSRCGKYCELRGQLKSLCFFVLFSILGTMLIKPLVMGTTLLIKLPAAMICLGGAAYIFVYFSKLEKYKH